MVGNLTEVYDHLFAELGPQNWWPGETSCEILVGAVLTQNTAWRNVERAIANLKDAGVLDIATLRSLADEELAELIRPAGYYRLKARRLKNLLDFVAERYGGSLEEMFQADLETLREGLLSVRGVGPETADSILLYAGHRPVFVVDAYTARIGVRHGWLEAGADYHQIQDEFQSQLPRDPQVYNEFHAMIVQLGKHYCHKRQPDCQSCPLKDFLPPGGPYSGDVDDG
ncbi:MAG: endonuclease III domain-containing protein [Pirellulales bacterium]